MTIDFSGRVAIVTGAGGGLGRAHAHSLAARGARVVVNDLGRSAAGSPGPADVVVTEISELGGSAMADHSDVTDFDQVAGMVDRTVEVWGRVDILINNAGILRDASFRKAELSDFRRVLDVHLMGAVHTCKAVWEHMISQKYGRILMTTSASGIYGNFGQANYGAAKSALVGLMNVLAIEGESKGIRVNALAPLAATGMTEDIFDAATADLLTPESITAGALFLVSNDAPTKTILGAGGGTFAVSIMSEAQGAFLPVNARTPDDVAQQWASISDTSIAAGTDSMTDQVRHFVEAASRGSTQL